MWEPWKYRVLRVYFLKPKLKRKWCLKLYKTRTQKFLMGVIVACGFCAKPSFFNCIWQKTMTCSLAKTSLFAFLSLLNSYKRVHLLKSARNKLLLRIRIIFRIRQLRDWRKQWPISDNLKVWLPCFRVRASSSGTIGYNPGACMMPYLGWEPFTVLLYIW